MPENNNRAISDDLIREALVREIDCVESSPSEDTWKKIESSLQKTRPSSKQRWFTWSRAAALAAACLVMVLGGIGIYRNLETAVPLADSEIAPEEAEDVGIFGVEDGVEQPGVLEEGTGRAVPGLELVIGEPDPAPPDWPHSLPGDYTLGETILITEAGDPFYSGAVYYYANTSLLLVEEETVGKDLAEFIDHLEGHLQVALLDLEEVNGFIRFTVDERLGLAWQKNDRNQALVVLSGFEAKGELKNIARSIE